MGFGSSSCVDSVAHVKSRDSFNLCMTVILHRRAIERAELVDIRLGKMLISYFLEINLFVMHFFLGLLVAFVLYLSTFNSA